MADRPKGALPRPRPKSWLNSPATVAVITGLLGTLGLVVGNNLHIDSLDFVRKSAFDKPVGTHEPRTAFCFWHQNSPAGFRLMQRQPDGKTWLETQPDGRTYHHEQIGRVNQGPWPGAVLRRLENPLNEPWPVQLFVPDKGVGNVLLYRPGSKTGWEYASVIQDSTANCPRPSAAP